MPITILNHLVNQRFKWLLFIPTLNCRAYRPTPTTHVSSSDAMILVTHKITGKHHVVIPCSHKSVVALTRNPLGVVVTFNKHKRKRKHKCISLRSQPATIYFFNYIQICQWIFAKKLLCDIHVFTRKSWCSYVVSVAFCSKN